MNKEDFEGIQKFKWLILMLIALLILFNIIGPIFYYRTYRWIFIMVQRIYSIKLIYYLIMTTIATAKALNIIGRVEKKRQLDIHKRKNIFHSIVVPVYHQDAKIVEESLSFLAQHSKAKQQYLVFIALEARTENCVQKGQSFIKMFESKFKLMSYTIHTLKEGEAPGKSSNQNYCLIEMQEILKNNSIYEKDVLFTTLDADNWMPEAYFEEMELHLSKNNWEMDRFMYAPGQMFTRNHMDVPLLNRAIDYCMGTTLFVWSNNLTQVQNAASNYSISYSNIKKYGFFDTNADAMCDDYHNSMRMIWKSQGQVRIVPIFVMANMISLQTGVGYLADTRARFWQAERHMRMFLDAAYNFNMLFKNKFRLRTFWATIAYFQNHFVPMGLYLTGIMFIASKLIMGKQFSSTEMALINTEALLSSIFLLEYFIVVDRSSKVLFSQKGQSIWRWIELVIINKLALLLFGLIPQVIATVRVTVQIPTFKTSQKCVETKND